MGSIVELTLQVRTHDGSAVLDCTGRLTGVFSRYLFVETVEDLLEKHKNVVLNLECVEKVDASALGAIAACVRCAVDHGATLRCFGAKKQVRQLLEVTRLSAFLKFYDSEKEAVSAVSAIAA
jgi:anti-sigma B factor antagonist